MKELLINIVEKNRKLTLEGKLADYIPALLKANKNHLGVTLKTEDGKFITYGEYSQGFTLQSISKVISFILAVSENGMDEVFKRVGLDSTDEPFNAFTKLDLPNVNKPANPMINSGAILTTSLIKGDGDEKFTKILGLTRLMANNESITFNEEVYLSEKLTGSRNRSMAYLMESKKILSGNVEDTLDTYFKQCAIEVNTRDLANIAGFISNGLPGLELKGISNKEMMLLVKGLLLTCGMYNYSAKYTIEVGIPSKSGVSGGIMAVLPRGGGIGIYSPGLDENGNSLAGLSLIKDLSKELKLNLLYNDCI